MTNIVLTPARFRTILTGDKRTASQIDAVIAHLTASGARFRTERAQWFVTRTDVDKVSTDDAAAEVGVTAGRVSQIATPLRRIVASGITLADVDDALYAHVYAVGKSGNGASKRIRAMVDTVSAIADVAGKRDAWLTLEMSDPAPRAPRVNDGSQTTDDDDATASAPADTGRTERPSTWTERLHALALEAESATIGDLDVAMDLVNRLSDAIAARMEGADVRADA